MLQAISKRLNREEKGFTLIELMVVVLIIAILIAIAVPTFLGARKRAQARSAQSNVRNAYSATKVYFSDNERFAPASAASQDASDLIAKLTDLEPSLTYAAGVSNTNPKQVAVRINDTVATATQPAVVNGVVCLSVQGADGNIYTLRDNSSGASAGVMYHKGSALPACTANEAAFTANGWN